MTKPLRLVFAGTPEFSVPPLDCLLAGPDGLPAYLSGAGRQERWVRVPADIVATRRDDPTTATRWRQVVREAMEDAFAQRFVATGVSRDHWYLFTPAQAPEEAR